MAQTNARTRGKAKKRERPLGAAIGLGLAVTLGVALAIFTALLLTPGSAVSNYAQMSLHAQSATLPLDPLYQQYKESINREDCLFVSPLSLFCGGLALGWLAPRYALHRRVLWAAAAMALGSVGILLAFSWSDSLYATNTLASHEGGYVARLIAPLDYVVRQIVWGVFWTAVCVLGAWLGLRLRDRRVPQEKDAAPALRAAPR